jgi:hypothetical protein
VITETTGPKISSRDHHLVGTVPENGGAEVVAVREIRVLRPGAALQHGRALVGATGDVALDGLALSSRDEGADLGLR